MKINYFIIGISSLVMLIVQCNYTNQKAGPNFINNKIISRIQTNLMDTFGSDSEALITRGVRHAASIWSISDGTEEDFEKFCLENFIADIDEKERVFNIISKNFESLWGYYNKIKLDLRENMDLDIGPYHWIDALFAGYSPNSHFKDDFFTNKIAFVIALNFPFYSLDEKNALGKEWTSLEWAFARLGDVFTERVPAEISQEIEKVGSSSEMYIADYNIHMGHLLNDSGQKLFPEDMVLLSHWNLRDELKSNYSNQDNGLEKQEMIYTIMKHIINQTIPNKVINSSDYDWNPLNNKAYKDGNEVRLTAEPNTRYQHILYNFYANKAADKYYSNYNTFIKRAFSGSKEIPQEEVEKLFDEYLSSPIVIEVGKLIEKRLGRALRPFDIWYRGFIGRSTIPEDKLTELTAKKYPNAKAFESDLSNILIKLGWEEDRAEYIGSKVLVDNARGSGHAWGAQMRAENAHLRTRISGKGMDYKGYHIAVHEFGHNVEQTISLHDVDYYLIEGVPNTAFTEALAFVFQKRDLQLLGLTNNNADKEYLETLGLYWNTFEIMGVSMVEMKMWKWLYENPDATASQLKEAVISISKEVWNKYFAEVFGSRDEIILAVYSHMINSPLYLSNYSFGHIIDFQIEQYLNGKDLSDEVDRIWSIGRLTPQIWMEKAIGENISIQPMVNASQDALDQVK
jgi:hypothetical protein